MRYQTFKGSQSGHCCFDATVVDTTKPTIYNGEHYKDKNGQFHYESICECLDIDDAQMICAQLNRADSLAGWLKWCLENCDDSPEYSFGTDATEKMQALLRGENTPAPSA